MTSLAGMRAALAGLGIDVADAPSVTQRDFALWPPAPAPCGPHAARQVARDLADAGAHSHLHAYGETVCLTGACPTHPVLDGVVPTHTPGEALL